MKLFKIFIQIAVIFSALIISSCKGSEEGKTKIRIVDLQGRPRPVSTKIPELNAQILASQGKKVDQSEIFVTSKESEKLFVMKKQNPVQNKYSDLNNQKNKSDQINKPVIVDQSRMSDVIGDVYENKQGQEQQDQTIVQYDLSQTDIAEEKQVNLALENSSKNRNRRNLAVIQKPKDSKKNIAKKTQEKIEEPAISSAVKRKGFFVQTGSFGEASNAKQSLASMKKFHQGSIEESVSGDKKNYRVLLGPFKNKQQAATLAKKINDSGSEAIVVRNR
jgi:cell division protein FtsN